MERIVHITTLLLMIAVLSCKKNDLFNDLRSGDYRLVVKGTYNGTAEYIGQGENYGPAVKRYRWLVEKNIDLLPRLTRVHFSAPGYLNYGYKMALLDRLKNFLVLRYFARIYGDPLIAGYQLFFVFDLSRDKLARVFSSEVPLE